MGAWWCWWNSGQHSTVHYSISSIFLQKTINILSSRYQSNVNWHWIRNSSNEWHLLIVWCSNWDDNSRLLPLWKIPDNVAKLYLMVQKDASPGRLVGKDFKIPERRKIGFFIIYFMFIVVVNMFIFLFFRYSTWHQL